MGNSDPVSIAQCRRRPPIPAKPLDGMIGFDNTPGGGEFYYRDLGKRNGLDILFIADSGGGSGQFTHLVGIERKGDTLRVAEEFASGDRCSGGLLKAEMRDGHVFYDTANSSADMISVVDKTSLARLAGGGLDWGLPYCEVALHWRDHAVIGARLSKRRFKMLPRPIRPVSMASIMRS